MDSPSIPENLCMCEEERSLPHVEAAKMVWLEHEGATDSNMWTLHKEIQPGRTGDLYKLNIFKADTQD